MGVGWQKKSFVLILLRFVLTNHLCVSIEHISIHCDWVSFRKMKSFICICFCSALAPYTRVHLVSNLDEAGVSIHRISISPRAPFYVPEPIWRYFHNESIFLQNSRVLALKRQRDHPYKTSANFHNFWPLPPYHRHSSKILMKGIFDPYVLWPFHHWHMGTPSPPKTCWRLKWMVPD